MTRTVASSWYERNQQYLMRAVHAVSDALRRHGSQEGDGPTSERVEESPDGLDFDPPPAIEQLCTAFGLSSFERNVLLLCAGTELDTKLAATVASAQKPSRGAPTFGLALAALGNAHWSALAPSGPLRKWRLIEVGTAETLTGSPLRIDERVLHFLAGVPHMDERLRGLVEHVPVTAVLSQSLRSQADSMVRALTEHHDASPPVIQLCGEEMDSKRALAASACAHLNIALYSMSAIHVPNHAAELDAFIRLWQREAVLGGCALLIEDLDGTPGDSAAREMAVKSLLDRIQTLVFVGTRSVGRALQRSTLVFDVRQPTKIEQKSLWLDSLGNRAAKLNGKLDAIGAQFDLDANSIQTACAVALREEAEHCELDVALWDACRAQARSKVDDLAQHIASSAAWDDIVLPQPQLRVLQEIAVHVRQRHKVYEQWGFGQKGSRGLGISALFAGPSGTGKTLAAEVLANELRLDLYRIDLSQVVSKYIGETEKNLRRVFDAAERGSGILLFDEADALFGKRSEVKDSHDRYANVEVSYLLQRMESYGGLAILTTNMQSALDQAFLRRLRFVVQFPFPDAAQRAEIWRRVFPKKTPTESLDYSRLSRLQVSGGNIQTMAMNAAFLAAEAQHPVRMEHLLQAARGEYAKAERSLNEAEIGGWQ